MRYQIRVTSPVGSLQCDLQFAERRIDVVVGSVIQAGCVDARVRLVNVVLQADLQLNINDKCEVSFGVHICRDSARADKPAERQT